MGWKRNRLMQGSEREDWRMRITTLGTSHGDHTYCRFNSSTLVDVGGELYLIDAGEPVTALLVRAGISPERLRAVLITHMHSDHVNGLPKMRSAYTSPMRKPSSH